MSWDKLDMVDQTAVTLDLTPRECVVMYSLALIGMSVMSSDAKRCAEYMQMMVTLGESGADVSVAAIEKFNSLIATMEAEVVRKMDKSAVEELLS